MAVVEDQHRFILTHDVMQKTTDDQVAVTRVETALAGFPKISSASFDKGFHSPANQIALAALIPQVVLPKKGKLSLGASACARRWMRIWRSSLSRQTKIDDDPRPADSL